MKLLHRHVVLLILEVCVISVAAVDPDEEEKCEGGPPGVEPGMTTSTAIEALGINNVERCQGDLSPNFIMDIEWRCETRYCCNLPCDCNQTHLLEHPCSPGPEIAQLRCLVQHLHPQPRFHKWKCCDGYVEHPDTHQCLITCAKDNGDCHQVCTPAVNPPYHAVCSCYAGHKEHEDDPKMCADHDECITANGGCTDHCNNTIGSYHCTCKEGRRFVEGSDLICEDIPVILPPETQPATQESDDSPTYFIIGAIVGGLVLLALLILLLVFLCRKKKRAEEEPYHGTAFANATYGDLDRQGQGARASVAEYGDTEEIKKKVPIDGAVGVDNPSYEGEKKALEAAGYAVPNHYEEIPASHGKKGRALDNPSYMTDSNDGYERPLGVGAKKMSLPGAVEDDQPVYPLGGANGARPKNGGSVVVPPEYSEIPTPGEVEADPRPPSYSNIGRQPVRFKDFQNVKYDNMNNEILDHHVDIKDIDVEDNGK